ncbi:MAG: hypothetical protein RL268_509 [Pseudomonadota bacterium]|jgi:hypothetical protein
MMEAAITWVGLLASRHDSVDVLGQVGGPVDQNGIVVLRVQPTAQTNSGAVETQRIVSDSSDAQAPIGEACLATQGRPMVYNARSNVWDRIREADGTTQGLTTSKVGVQVWAKASEWTEVHTPAAATQATITRAAGAAGVRHVCTGIVATLACAAAASGPLTVTLLDGAAVRWAGVVSAPVQGCAVLQVDGMAIVGTAATAMTLQFSAAGAAGSLEAVTLMGYSTAA